MPKTAAKKTTRPQPKALKQTDLLTQPRKPARWCRQVFLIERAPIHAIGYRYEDGSGFRVDMCSSTTNMADLRSAHFATKEEALNAANAYVQEQLQARIDRAANAQTRR